MVSVKGAPEEVMARVNRMRVGAQEPPVTDADRVRVAGVMEGYGRQGLRVLAFARRCLPSGASVPEAREDAERDLCLVGLVAMQVAWQPLRDPL